MTQQVGPVITETVLYSVAASADDACVDAQAYSFNVAGPVVVMGDYPPDYVYQAGFRFAGVTLPAGSQLISAELRMTAAGSSGTPVSLTVRGETAGAPGPYTSYDDLMGRALTAGWASFGSAEWTDGQEYAVDVTGVVSEIVAGGWTSGSAMAFQVLPGTPGVRHAWSVDEGRPAQLRLSYARAMSTSVTTYTYRCMDLSRG
jgi:hypothetical protein